MSDCIEILGKSYAAIRSREEFVQHLAGWFRDRPNGSQIARNIAGGVLGYPDSFPCLVYIDDSDNAYFHKEVLYEEDVRETVAALSQLF